MGRDIEEFVREATNIASIESVSEGELLDRYEGTLDDRTETRILSVAPDTSDAVEDAFRSAIGKWANPSSHQNIVSVYDHDTYPWPWAAVESVTGQPLDAAQPNLHPTEVKAIITDTAAALRNAALYNASHTALSPQHIWVVPSENGVRGVVDDWGVTQAVRRAAGTDDVTPFTAPETLTEDTANNEKLDVYGLGAIAYFALTGEPPISGTDISAAIEAGDIDPPSALNDVLSEAVDTVILQALAHDPSERHDSAYAFKQAFERAYDPDKPATKESTAAVAGAEESESTDQGGNQTTSASETNDDGETTPDGTESEATTSSRRAALGVLGLGVIGVGGGWLALTGSNDNDDDDSAPSTTDSPTSTPPTSTSETSTSTTDETSSPSGISSLRATGFPRFQYDNQNSGFRSEASGPASSPSLRWQFGVDGNNHTTPVIGDGTAYFGGGGGDSNRTNNVYAVDTTDGSEMWSFPSDASFQSCAALSDTRVFIANDAGTLFAIEAETGDEMWSQSFGAASYLESPLLVDGRVIIGDPEGGLFAFDATSGDRIWGVDDMGSVRASPAYADDTVYVGTQPGTLTARSIADGSVDWERALSGEIRGIAVADGTLYVTMSTGALRALSSADGTEQWVANTDYEIGASPAVGPDSVYVGDGNNFDHPGKLYSFARSDGAEEWTFAPGDSFGGRRGAIVNAPVVASGQVFFGADSNRVGAVTADDGSLAWRFQNTGVVLSSPSVHDGVVYFGADDNSVYALE